MGALHFRYGKGLYQNPPGYLLESDILLYASEAQSARKGTGSRRVDKMYHRDRLVAWCRS